LFSLISTVLIIWQPNNRMVGSGWWWWWREAGNHVNHGWYSTFSSSLTHTVQKTHIVIHHMMGCQNFCEQVHLRNEPTKHILVYIEIFLLHILVVNSHFVCSSYNTSCVV